MAEPRIRPTRFSTQPGEVRIGRIVDGRWRPLTATEAAERDVPDTYDRRTGKVQPAGDGA